MNPDMPTAENPSLYSGFDPPGYRVEALAHSVPGFGRVYRARRLETDAAVLLTVLAPGGSNDRRLRERFARWTAQRAELEHDVLASLLDAGYVGDEPFVAVAHPAGVELPALLAGGPLSPARVLGILGPVADLLDRLAARNLTAGVVPARTITVGAGNQPVLTELGLVELSLLAHRQGDMPRDAVFYAAPELLRGLKSTVRTDVYALAALAFEMLTGRALWAVPDTGPDGQVQPRAVMARRASPPPVVSTRRLGLGPQVDTVLKHALAEDAAIRPVSALELLSQLRLALAPQSATSMRRGHEPATGTRVRRPGTAPAAKVPATSPRRPERADGTQPPAPAVLDRQSSMPLDSSRHRRRPSSAEIRRTGVPVLAAAAILGSVLAVVAEPRAPQPATASPGTLVAASDALGLDYPSTWRLLRDSPGLAGLPLRDPIALEPVDDLELEPRVRLLAGMVDSTDARLLPLGIDRRLRETPDQEPVRLDDHGAFRYRDVSWRGETANVTLYAVPTTRGVATVACLAPEWDRPRIAECDAIATTLRVEAGRSLPLGPNRAFGARLDEVLRELDSSRRIERARLGRARSAPGQARRAVDLAAVYDGAAQELTRGRPPAGTAETRAAIARRLQAVGATYRELSSAALRRDRTGFNRARNALVAQDAGVDAALARLRSLGYRRT